MSQTEATPQDDGLAPERWTSRIDDAMSVEKDWRDKGKEAIGIYRAERQADGASGRGRFNMLFANTSILFPSMYQQPPQADVRRRFQRADDLADAASGVLQGALNSAFEIGNLDAEIRRAVQEVLLPGRGTIRVRWVPTIEDRPAIDPMTGAPLMGEDSQPVMEPRKTWETLEFEHVFWEDFVVEPVRRWRDAVWCAFRLYLTRSEIEKQFGDDPKVMERLKDEEWMRGAFVHSPVDLQREDRKAQNAAEPRVMLWECWDRERRTIDWIVPGQVPLLLRRDEDPLDLELFFPCPEPMTSIATTNSQVPVPEYEIWRDLAAEVARITDRIDAIIKRMRVRGMFNGSVEELADVLDGEDGQMIAVSGVDMEAAMNTNVWLLPLDILATTAVALYGAREQAKQALYEVSGISDVLRGASDPRETLGAQRIKGNFGTLRIDDRRRGLSSFLRDLTRISAEIMASRFSASTLSIMSGREIQPELEEYLRKESRLMCNVDIETDSTVAIDQSAEQEASQTLVSAVGGLIQTFGPLVQNGMVPREMLAELLKMILKPFKGSRDLLDLIGQAMAAAEQNQGAQQEQPDPAAEAARTELELKAAGAKQDMQIKAEEHQADMAQRSAEMQMDGQEHEAKMRMLAQRAAMAPARLPLFGRPGQ
ncbi:hypothetical protein [Aureimonas mangrovi]|uniref:hypothetical protein n=1 Tax=Aureimonas mangrovi TaxID=2758041 RepID=UPI00163D7E5B|nr:hypothetical protein [Aureimonas mangrovi]